MKKALIALSIMLLMSTLAACGTETTAQAVPHPTPTRAPTATPTPIISPLLGTFTTTLTKQDLAGHPEYMNTQGVAMDLLGTWQLQFESNGYFVAINGLYYAGTQYVGTGRYTVTQNQLTITKDPKCYEFYGYQYGEQAEVDTYTWTLQGDTLTLKTAQDFCAARFKVFTTHPWHRQS